MLNSKLAEYERLLESWPGLTSGPAGALIEDCLSLLPHLDGVTTLIDVGAGGGMPGLPLKLARPDVAVTLLEADSRKAAFLVQAVARLGLAGVTVVTERAETAAHGPLREWFDAATCRALASLPVAVELCLGFVRPGGRLLAMRTAAEVERGEVGASAAAIERLGGGEAEVVPAPSAAREHGVLVLIPKLRPAGPGFPRRPGVPNKRPLRG